MIVKDIFHFTSLLSFLQTATDSSSNSSQKREPAMHTLAPHNFCEARRHHCILGHFYEHHRPTDHYFLDQVSGGPRVVLVTSDKL